jgi:hypothetical protein
MDTPATPAAVPGEPAAASPDEPNAFQRRLPIVVAGAAVFVVLLVITAITQNNGMGTAVAIYGIVGGVLLGRLLAAAERDRAPSS